MEETVDEMSVTSTREHVDEIEVDDIERVCMQQEQVTREIKM